MSGMRPFQEFRFWAERAPATERAVTATVAVAVLSLLAWLLVPDSESGVTSAAGASVETRAAADGSPVGSPSASDSAAETDAPAETGASGANSGSPRQGQQTDEAPSSPGAAVESQSRCPAAPPGTKGVTDDEIHFAIVLTELIGPAANSLMDIPDPADAQADYDAAIAGINGEGGIGCRKVVAHYFKGNPADQRQETELCRDIADGDYFGVLDTGTLAVWPVVLACFGQQKLLFWAGFFITETARTQFYPYLNSFYTKEYLYKATAFGLREVGFYDASFNKLGYIYRSCEAEAVAASKRWIRESGVPDEKIVEYSLGCPAAFANESDLAQVALTFKREGVTHVTGAYIYGDLARITAHFEQQNYRPKWGLPDEAMLSISGGTRVPNPDNLNGAVAITLGRDGENNTPGMTPTPGTQKCNAYREVQGLPPVYDAPANAGHACDQLWMVQHSVANAPDLSAAGIQAGLARAGSIDWSYPQGPNDFRGAGKTTGGQFWRVARFFRDECTCWRVVQPEFRRNFLP